MKASELTVGNWVEHDGNIIQIAAVHKRKIGWHRVPQRLEWVRLSEVDPIALTDEIIEKNGFEWDGMIGHGHVKDDIGVAGYKNVYSIWMRGRIGCNVKYVHELQNVLSLIGEDCNIKL